MMNREQRDLRIFGVVFAGLMILFSYRFGFKEEQTVVGFLFIAASLAFVALTLFALPILASVRKPFMKAAHILGTVLTAVVLTIVYYLVFGVVGIFLRIFKKDFLNQVIDPQCSSYWIKRSDEEFSKNRYTQQF